MRRSSPVASAFLAQSWPWEDLYRDLGPRLLRLGARRYGLSRQDAEDCLQRTVAEVGMAGPAARNREAYLVSAFLRQAARAASSGRAAATTLRPIEDLGEDEVPRDETAAQRIDDAIAFRRAFSALTPACRDLIRSWAVDGLDVKSSAAANGLSKANAYRKLRRCIKRLASGL